MRKGEKGSLVVYANFITRKETDVKPAMKSTVKSISGRVTPCSMLSKIEGLPQHYYTKPAPRLSSVQRIDHAETFFANLRTDIRQGGTQVYYAQEHDYIYMPPIEAFCDAESYYATLAHESTHWTKHPTRLAREFGRKQWGDEDYAEEELVAGLGAAGPLSLK